LSTLEAGSRSAIQVIHINFTIIIIILFQAKKEYTFFPGFHPINMVEEEGY
jgi:hypothetical protein